MFVFEFWREAPDFVVVKIWSRLVKNTFFTQKYNDFSIIMFHKKNSNIFLLCLFLKTIKPLKYHCIPHPDKLHY